MTDEKPSAPRPIAKRRAWRFRPPEAPGLDDFMAGGDKRKAFVRYWISDNLWNGLHLIGHFGLKILPVLRALNQELALGLSLSEIEQQLKQRARSEGVTV